MIKGKKYYKNLYECEINNRKLLMEQNSRLSNERIKRDEENAKLRIELEDLNGFYIQEKECSNALRKERTKLKREITMLKKELGKDGK